MFYTTHNNSAMLSTVFSNIYPSVTLDNINALYSGGEHFVFRRKKHSSHLYVAYSKAHDGATSQESLTYPAFPTFFLPPEDVLVELEKSPKLSLKDGFREKNWLDMLGEFYCNLDALVIPVPEGASKTLKRKLNALTRTEKLLVHLNQLGAKDDEYVYSIYYIQKKTDNSYHCYHLTDITQKYTGEYSEKSKKYIVYVEPYVVTFADGAITSVNKRVA